MKKIITIVRNKIKQKKFTLFLKEDYLDNIQKIVLPRKVLINTMNACNANCVFCAYQYKKDKPMKMTNELFQKIVKEYNNFDKDSFVSLSPTVGDPLVDSTIFQKIKLAKTNGIKKLQFYTNSILLEDNIDNILNSKLDILEISFPDFNKEEYIKIFRVDKYDKSLNGIYKLLKKHKEIKSNMLIDINLRPRRDIKLIKREEDFINFIQPFLSEIVTVSYIKQFDNWTGLIKQEDLPVGMKLSKDKKHDINKPCGRLFDMMFLEDGSVKLCGCRFNGSVYDELVIGNINEKPLNEIWFSQKVFDIRNNFFKGIFPDVCKNCSMYEPVSQSILKKQNKEI